MLELCGWYLTIDTTHESTIWLLYWEWFILLKTTSTIHWELTYYLWICIKPYRCCRCKIIFPLEQANWIIWVIDNYQLYLFRVNKIICAFETNICFIRRHLFAFRHPSHYYMSMGSRRLMTLTKVVTQDAVLILYNWYCYCHHQSSTIVLSQLRTRWSHHRRKTMMMCLLRKYWIWIMSAQNK